MEEFNTDVSNPELESFELDKLEASLFQDNAEKGMDRNDVCRVWRQVRGAMRIMFESKTLHPKCKKAVQILGRTLDRLCNG